MSTGKELMELADEITTTTSRGTSVSSTYTNRPTQYAPGFLDAARKRLYFLQTVNVKYLEPGHADLIEYKRTAYLGSDGFTFDSGEASTSDISNTSVDNLDGVQITPAYYAGHITTTEWNIRTNRFALIDRFREEIVYAAADKVDQYIATALGDATESTSSATGAIQLYGGDATSDSTLASSDILTPDLIVKAAKFLGDKYVYYWDSTTFTKVAQATAVKNPWMNEDDYVLFIGPSQHLALQQDTQFSNAAEYGSNDIVLNGQVAKYQGVKIVMTSNVEQVASGSTGPDGTTASADMTRCILMKPSKAFTFVWGKEPEVTVSKYERRKQVDIVGDMAYAGKVIHDDAIVWIDVAD